jgi:hypothetical protein
MSKRRDVRHTVRQNRKPGAFERQAIRLVLLVALLQGITYLLLLPPWQHYDEPSHFEYAWLMANLGDRPTNDDVDQGMRRAVIASMIEHDFYTGWANPPDLNSGASLSLGFPAFSHPTAYYVLVSLPLRLAAMLDLDVTTQLYLARTVSFGLFLLTVGVAVGMMRDLTSPGHVLRWGVPLVLVLLPPFVDVMTSVNSDVGAALVASLFLWGSVRTIRYGITWQRVGWVVGAALLAVMTKNTAAVTIVLVPLVLLLSFWLQRGWSWRWFGVGGLGLGILLLPLFVGWGDAAYWYRWWGMTTHEQPTRTPSNAAATDGHAVLIWRDAPDIVGRLERWSNPLGAHALQLEAVSDTQRRLINPLLEADIDAAAGKTITVGGWLWADRPVTAASPGVVVHNRPAAARNVQWHPVELTTRPTFVSWTFKVSEQISGLHYAFLVPALAADEPPLRVYLDGAVLALGELPTDTAPVFDDASARSGTWGDQRFVNLVRNPSAEQAWPRLRPWVEPTLNEYVSLGAGRTPSKLLAAMVDVERTSELLLSPLSLIPFDTTFTRLAWGHVVLTHPAWMYVVRGLWLAALLGGVLWWLDVRRPTLHGLRPALALLAVAGALVWLSTLTRTLPRINEGLPLPMARYTFPAILVTILALVGGWWSLWPRRWRPAGMGLLLMGMLVLNLASVRRALEYYYGW